MVVPAGTLSLPLRNMRTLLANCAAFQAWTGTVGVPAAEVRVVERVEDDAAITRPFVLIGEDSWSEEEISSGQFTKGEGTIALLFEEDVAGPTSIQEALYSLTNNVGLIWADMKTLSKGNVGGPFINVRSATLKAMQRDSRQKVNEDRVRVDLMVMWSPF